MKAKYLAFSILAVCLIVHCFTVYAEEGQEAPLSNMYQIDYLPNGDYIVTWTEDIPVYTSFGKNNVTIIRKTSKSYYSSDSTHIFKTTLTGTFSYNYGISSIATDSEVTVYIYASGASFVSKSASTSGNSAFGTGTVNYLGRNITLNLQLTCDIYGNVTGS